MVRLFAYDSGGGIEKPAQNEPAPDSMDWNMWCGPAPVRPFTKKLHPGGWRNFLDYANGTLGDWGVHLRAAVGMASLPFQIPVEIEARLSVDERGQVRVTTSRVQAVGATLPESVTAELGRRVDDQGTRAIADALPPGSVARRVVVESDRIRVELAS